MLFHTPPFAVFLFVVWLVFNVAPFRWLPFLFTVASYIFYGWAIPKYVILMFASSLGDFLIAKYFSGRGERLKRFGITFSACFNFGMLGYYKYGNFAIENVRVALEQLGINVSLPTLSVILPVGISFYSFHTFCYVYDALTGKIKPCQSFLQFTLFVSWFPQLVAGPIARADQLLEQLQDFKEKQRTQLQRLPEAILLFTEGWMRKYFADCLAPIANDFYARDLSAMNSWEAIFAVIAFSLQIYGDFCGYTRMAQGVSWLFGVRLAENFNVPYFAIGAQDFWRRWHISLSTWFRDYLYIPLGGNRGSRFRASFNMVFTMLVSGLWHGASWNFILWGAIHSTYMLAERWGGSLWARIPFLLRIPVTFALMSLAWIPFRAPDFNSAYLTFKALFAGGQYLSTPEGFVLGAAGLFALDFWHVLTHNYERSKFALQRISYNNLWVPGTWIATCVLLWIAFWTLYSGRPEMPFIYFQF